MGFSQNRLVKSRPRVHLIVIFFVVITQIINALCWILYVQKMSYELGNPGVMAYMVFACVGLVVFIIVSGPLIYWPYSHGSEMSPMARNNTFCLGVTISFFLHHFPMMWMEIWIVRRVGWTEIFQGISLILTVICFAVGFFTTWLSYTWRVSKFLQIRYGDAASSTATVPAARLAEMSKVTRI